MGGVVPGDDEVHVRGSEVVGVIRARADVGGHDELQPVRIEVIKRTFFLEEDTGLLHRTVLNPVFAEFELPQQELAEPVNENETAVGLV
jgi:hypothetical protein